MKYCIECKDKSCAVKCLSHDQLLLFSENSSGMSLKTGEVLLKQGSLTETIYYLRSGLLAEFRLTENGRNQVTQIHKDHSYIGLTSLFGNNMFQYSYKAIEDSLVCHISADVFKEMIRSNGDFAYELLVCLSQDELRNYHLHYQKQNKKLYGRVADILIYFADIVYESMEFNMPLTRLEMADLTGVARESMQRVLSCFVSEGIIIIINKHEIRLTNYKKLKHISRTG